MSESGKCDYCGATAPDGAKRCSAACDLARRLPLGEKDLPATWQLGALMGWLFIGFNQLLFFGMGHVARGKGDFGSAENFDIASLAAGALVLSINVVLFAISKPKTGRDMAGFWGSYGIGLLVYGIGLPGIAATEVVSLFLANVLSIIWLLRGLWQNRSSKKREKR